MATEKIKPFGLMLREKRVAKGYTLRKFAELIAVSPTYLSQVEQGNVDPPTAERVSRIAELLGENTDAMIALAGRVPDDLSGIIKQRPTQFPELLREASGMTAEQLGKLVARARQLKGKEG